MLALLFSLKIPARWRDGTILILVATSSKGTKGIKSEDVTGKAATLQKPKISYPPPLLPPSPHPNLILALDLGSLYYQAPILK